MQFELNEEQVELQRSIRAFVGRYADPIQVLAQIDGATGYDTALWSAAATKLGLQGLAVAEDSGGMGAGVVDLVTVIEELAAGVVPGPLAPCIGLAVPILAASPRSDVSAELLMSIAEGQSIPAVAQQIFEPDAGASGVVGSVQPNGLVRVTGTTPRVLTPLDATVYLLLASVGGEIAVLAAPAGAPGLRVVGRSMMDPTRREGDLELADVDARIVAVGEDALRVCGAARRAALLFAAAEAVGGAQRTLDLAVHYAQERTAFGKVIGSFQALKHRMADMYTEVEASRSLLWYAAWLTSVQESEAVSAETLELALLEAKLVATESYMFCARSSLGVFGGIGYTWEHPIHLYFKRATSLRFFAQSNESVRDEIASRTMALRRRPAAAIGDVVHS